MILKKKETAEQKLLKMIEASSGDAGAASRAQRKTSRQQDALSLLKTFNSLLLILIVGVAVLVGLEIKKGMDIMGAGIDIQAERGMTDSMDGDKVHTVQKLPFYLAGVNRRNIFRPYDEQIFADVSPVQELMTITRKTENLRLVGISWMDRVESASAMIEDTEKQVTYFLQKGEKIGNIEVKTIYADSVELALENEEMILRYDKPQL